MNRLVIALGLLVLAFSPALVGSISGVETVANGPVVTFHMPKTRWMTQGPFGGVQDFFFERQPQRFQRAAKRRSTERQSEFLPEFRQGGVGLVATSFAKALGVLQPLGWFFLPRRTRCD